MLALPYVSDANLTSQKIATICIAIVVFTLFLNISFSLAGSIIKLYKWIKARKMIKLESVVPLEKGEPPHNMSPRMSFKDTYAI